MIEMPGDIKAIDKRYLGTGGQTSNTRRSPPRACLDTNNAHDTRTRKLAYEHAYAYTFRILYLVFVYGVHCTLQYVARTLYSTLFKRKPLTNITDIDLFVFQQNR